MTTAINGKVIVATGPVDYGGCNFVLHSVGEGYVLDTPIPPLKAVFKVLNTGGDRPTILYEIFFDAAYILDELPTGKREYPAERVKGPRKVGQNRFTDMLMLEIDFDLLYIEFEEAGALAIFEGIVKGARKEQIEAIVALAAG